MSVTDLQAQAPSRVGSSPVLSGVSTSTTFLENTVNGAPQLLDAVVTFNDPDNNFDGGTLRVSGLLAEDIISIRNEGNAAGQIGFASGEVSYEGTVIGTVSGGAGADLEITFNAAATSTAVDALIQNLTYANTSDAPTASRTLTIDMHDAAGMALISDRPRFTELTGAANPFGSITTSYSISELFVQNSGADGDIDFYHTTPDDTLVFYTNTGTPFVPQFELTAIGFEPLSRDNVVRGYMADLNGDGLVDYLEEGFWIGGASNALYVSYGTGTLDIGGGFSIPLFGAPNELTGLGLSGAGSVAAALGDLDGDGDFDLMVVVDAATIRTYANTSAPQIQVNVTAEPDPVAADDAFTTGETTVLGAGRNLFDANSTTADDADGGPAFSITHVNGAAVVGSQITLASGALLTVNADGTFSYDPNGAFQDLPATAQGGSSNTRNDSFTYTITGGDTATVSITVTGIDNDDTINGNALANILAGGEGNDTLNGRAGNDELFGEADNDILRGGNGDDTLAGGEGNDFLNGGTGNDAMSGGSGNDRYIVESADDTVNELAGEGTADRVISSLSYTLGAEVENLLLTGGGTIDGTGNGLANRIIGNAAANTLDGGEGNDFLTGGLGADQFQFTTALGATNIDRIADFVVAEDTIALDDAIFAAIGATLDAGEFYLTGSGPRDADDYIIYNATSGALFYDADGNGAGAAIRFAVLTGSPDTLSASNFIIV